MTKTCSRCHQTKELTEFGKNSINKDGLSGQCRACRTEIQRERRSTDPDYRERQRQSNLRSTRRRYKAHPRQPVERFTSWQDQAKAVARVTAARRQAKKFGAQVNDLTFEDWLAIEAAQNGQCFYCHKRAPLEIEHKIPLARGGDNTAANVVGACQPCNWAKRLRTAEQYLNNLCVNDHEMTPANTYRYPGTDKTACRKCQRASQLRYRERKRQKRSE